MDTGFKIVVENFSPKIIFNILRSEKEKIREDKRGLFTWPNQDDRMNMTKIVEHDWKIENDEH